MLVIFLAVVSLSAGFRLGPRLQISRKGQQIKFHASSDDEAPKPVPKLGFGALIQLITMGAGAPGLGEFDYTDDTGKMFFKLEANNLTDEEGNSRQLKQKYFVDGYVEKEDADKPPGFFSNLLRQVAYTR